MVPFGKTYKSASELVQLLKSRGLVIEDETRAERYLSNIGYYRLSAYMYPFLQEPKTDHRFKNGTRFEQILRLYRFDKKLRVTLFNEIEKIEIAFRQAVANTTAEMSGDMYWMTNPVSYSNPGKASHSIGLISTEYKRSTEDFAVHFKNTYSEPFPPAWILGEILPLGNITWLYSNLADQRIRKAIAKKFYLQPPVLDSWMTVITLTRNACCHHARMWNKVNSIVAGDMKKMTRPWISPTTDKRRVYSNICLIKYFLDIISPSNDFREKLELLFKSFPEIDLRAMGFPTDWKQEPLWKSAKPSKGCFIKRLLHLKK